MTKNEIIRSKLGISYLTYDNLRHRYFDKWCYLYATKMAVPLRQLTGNDYLHNWYLDAWMRLVECQFFIDNEDYLNSGIEDPDSFQDLFLSYPAKIEDYYPKPLIELIKKELKKVA